MSTDEHGGRQAARGRAFRALMLGLAWTLASAGATNAAAEGTPEGQALVARGGAHLLSGQADSAEAAFREALKDAGSVAPARVGLGRVALELRGNARRAVSEFKDAVSAAPESAETWGWLARAHLWAGREGPAEEAARKALAMDGEAARPHLVLAQVEQRKGNRAEALAHFEHYLDHDDGVDDAALGFSIGWLRKKDYDAVKAVASRMRGVERLPLLAQVRAAAGEHEEAFALFAAYVDSLPAEERALYLDVSLVGTREEAAGYAVVKPEDREAFLAAFWLRHDPFQTSGGAMRRAEHYRRVWHARMFYGRKKRPWDRRGDVYIRYGEPDYRSAWHEVNARVPKAVQAVQEKIAFQLYGRRGLDLSYVGPVYPLRTTGRDDEDANRPLEEKGIDVGLLGWKPVVSGSDWAAMPWEVWVYADVDGGIEVTFTDELHTGVYQYAPVPAMNLSEVWQTHTRGSPLTFAQKLTQFAPATRVTEAAGRVPERFDTSGLHPLNFYYEPLSFRGPEGTTDLQINFGLPLDEVTLPEDVGTTVFLERRVALVDTQTVERARLVDEMALPVTKATRSGGFMARDRINVELPPGPYSLAVQYRRPGTDRTGVFRQPVTLHDFSGDSLALSDLQLAQHVEAATAGADPRLVRGAWSIVSAPSRAFHPDSPIALYFEIYNLTLDAFGATGYEVTFSVRSEEGRPTSQPRIRKRDGESVSVRYEQRGTDATVADFVELEPGKLKPGRYAVVMVVTDLQSGQKASREGGFRVVRP